MAGDRWIFTPEQLANTPSRKCNISADKELNYRQQAATLIQDMGQRLQVYPSVVFVPSQHHEVTVTSCVADAKRRSKFISFAS